MSSRIAALLGFSNGRSAASWAIFSGGLFAFLLAHLRFLDFDNCYYFMRLRLLRTGITLHVRCTIPAWALAGLQFIPAIRRYTPAAHRINGYITMCKAYRCVRRRQIEFHRAWMLRSWSYASAVITQCVIMPLSATLVTLIGGYSLAQPCDKIDSVLKDYDNMVALYPACSASDWGRTTGQGAIVVANINSDDIMQLVTAFSLSYGTSSWMALTIHAICAELYWNGSAQPKPLRDPDSCYASCNTEET
ncbi:hypothetical protein F5Y01DRAFT_306272 [Xylaria sp. FL0043]|nr:hypothetical protein F5Y01DRAFT_306272 [Xylaria sp. FL0043]